MDRETLLKLVGALPDSMILKALSSSGINVAEPEDHLAGMDPGNQVKGWSGISLTRGPDDRPAMADKNYLLDKLSVDDKQGVSSGEVENYTGPF